MKKKPFNLDTPTYEPTERCDTCGEKPASDFGTERLCANCVANDVFGDYGEGEE